MKELQDWLVMIRLLPKKLKKLKNIIDFKTFEEINVNYIPHSLVFYYKRVYYLEMPHLTNFEQTQVQKYVLE